MTPHDLRLAARGAAAVYLEEFGGDHSGAEPWATEAFEADTAAATDLPDNAYADYYWPAFSRAIGQEGTCSRCGQRVTSLYDHEFDAEGRTLDCLTGGGPEVVRCGLCHEQKPLRPDPYGGLPICAECYVP